MSEKLPIGRFNTLKKTELDSEEESSSSSWQSADTFFILWTILLLLICIWISIGMH